MKGKGTRERPAAAASTTSPLESLMLKTSLVLVSPRELYIKVRKGHVDAAQPNCCTYRFKVIKNHTNIHWDACVLPGRQRNTWRQKEEDYWRKNELGWRPLLLHHHGCIALICQFKGISFNFLYRTGTWVRQLTKYQAQISLNFLYKTCTSIAKHLAQISFNFLHRIV